MKTVNVLLVLLFGTFNYVHASDTFKNDTPKKTYRATNTRVTDIIHTKLEVKFDWNKSQVIGTAYITAKPYFNATGKIDLNARGMNIQSVEVFDLSAGKSQKTINTKPVEGVSGSIKLASTYKYENDTLKIDLGRQFTANEKYMVKVNYVAKPDELAEGGSAAITEDKGMYFINPKGEDKTKMPQIWTQGETMGNSAWFPTIDSPNEKMTNEIFMTVDNKYTTLSNGLLTDSKKNTDGTRTDHWKMDIPHSPYLVMLSVGDFKKVTDTPWNGKEVSYYVEKEYKPYAKSIFGNTKEMIEFYSNVLGTPYPWQKYSQIVVRDFVSGAMENTTATLHGDFMVYQTDREMIDSKKGEDVISHELFHQWFGDLVTAESWSNLPLNESFATYGEYLWEEHKYGRDAADAHSYKSKMGYFSQANNQVDMIRFDYDNKEDMFDAYSYNKGGQILHMLRKYVGDNAFFASLKLYLEKNKFKNAEIHDLRLAFEEVTGEDLNWFFNQWFLAKGHPTLNFQNTYDAASKTLKIIASQDHDIKETPLYTLPLDVDIYFNGIKERHRIVITEKNQEFKFIVAAEPDLINFDGEKQLLCNMVFNRSVKGFIFEYEQAPLYADRLEALNNLKDKLKEPEVLALFLKAAENDKWFELRNYAIFALETVAKEKESELKPLMIKIATSDKNTNVRAVAVRFLGDNYTGAELKTLYEKSLTEQSYAIISAALKSITKADPSIALQKAKQFENEKNKDVLLTVAYIYSDLGSDDNAAFFTNSAVNFTSYSLFEFMDIYARFLKRCNKIATFEKAAKELVEFSKQSTKYVNNYAKKAFNDGILTTLESKREALIKEKASPEAIKEIETAKNKLEELFKSISTS
ncbi:MAG: M1 family aminopeptidase [Bacteroidia bacterium]